MSNLESALSAFADAQADASAVDWQAIAAALAAAVPAPKRRKASADAAPAWWVSYALPRAQAFISERCHVLFADGVTIRGNVHRVNGKPWRVEAAVRYAVALWHRRTGSDDAAPEILAMGLTDGTESWDGATVTRLSAEIRAPLPPVRPAPRAITLDAVDRLTAEIERRRAGLARAVEAETRARKRRAYGPESFYLAGLPESHVESEHWRAALNGARKELAAVRRALGLSAPARTVAPVLASVAPAWDVPQLFAPAAPVALDCEAIAEQLAEAYAAPEAWEILGTVDAPEPEAVQLAQLAEPAPRPEPTPAAPAPAASPTPAATTADPVQNAADYSENNSGATVDTPSAPPGEAIATGTPDEAIGDAWEGPTDRSHPVTALCLSPEARRALLARVMDGTAPAEGRTARGGAWRISMADARDLQGIPGIRWVGMPRKVTTRRHLPPLHTPAEAIRSHAPGEAIGTVPHAAYIPGAGRMPSPVTFHAAP